MSWIGVDLDGTLAYYDKWRGETHIGPPIPVMLERVKFWLANGVEVRIVTARVATNDEKELVAVVSAIDTWCNLHLGQTLSVTCSKDYDMVELWDDRVVQVEKNTGRRVDER